MPATGTHGLGAQLNSKTDRANTAPTAMATHEASNPDRAPTPKSSARCMRCKRPLRAPRARITAYSRTRASRVAVMVATSTNRPEARVKANRNSTALMTWLSTCCTCATDAEMSTLVMFGNACSS